MGWSRDRKVLAALVGVYLLALLVLVSGPWGWELNRLTVRLYVAFRYDWPIAPDWASPHHYGFLLNILLFMPLGALAVLLTRRTWWLVTLTAALGSAGIEVVQGLFLARVGEVNDVVANTLGAMLGTLAVTLPGRLRSRRAGRPGSPRPR